MWLDPREEVSNLFEEHEELEFAPKRPELIGDPSRDEDGEGEVAARFGEGIDLGKQPDLDERVSTRGE